MLISRDLWVGDVMVLLLGVSCVVFVYLCDPYVVMVVFWSIVFVGGVYEWVYFYASSEDIEVWDVEDA